MLDNSSSCVHGPVDFQKVFESLPGNFVILQPNAPHYTILAISDEAVSTMGREKQSIIGKNLFEVFPGNPEATSAPGPSNLETSLRNALEHKRVDRMPLVRYDVTNPEGEFEERYWAASNKPVMNQQGEVIYLIHTTSEVTEQVLTRNRMEESESRFRSMIEQVPVAIGLTLGKDHVFQDINPSMLRIMRKEHKEEVIGKELIKVMPELEDQVMMKILQDVLGTGRPYIGSEIPAQVNVQGKLELGYYHLSYTPLVENGKVTGIIHAASDVTEQVLTRQKVERYAAELQESERRYRSLVQASNDTLYRMSPDWKQLYALEGKIFLSNTDKPNDNWVNDNLPPAEQEQILGIVKKAIDTKSVFELEHRMIKADGTIGWTLSRAIPVLDPRGEIMEWFGAASDITEQKLAQGALEESERQARALARERASANRELLAANDSLSRTNADLDNFIYAASHDLKSPILNIEGLMDALLDKLPPESLRSGEIQHITGMILNAVQRFKRTIHHLTEITKLQKENSQEPSQVDLATVLADVQLDLAPAVQGAQAQVEVDVAACPTVRFSEKNLRSIVYNLLSNALKYRSPDRPPRIQVRCRETTEYQVLSVRDNGLGMDLTRGHRLFEMFRRLHDHVEGTGIGLYMVKKIIETAGGRIEVQSTVGEGSVFSVYFRLNPAVRGNQSQRQQTQ